MTQAVFTSDQSRTHLNFHASVDTGFDVNGAIETNDNVFLPSVNARANADARCEYTFIQIVTCRISFWNDGNLPALSTPRRSFTLFCVRYRSQGSSFTYQSLLLQSEEFVTFYFSINNTAQNTGPGIRQVEPKRVKDKHWEVVVLCSSVFKLGCFSLLSDFLINMINMIKLWNGSPMHPIPAPEILNYP